MSSIYTPRLRVPVPEFARDPGVDVSSGLNEAAQALQQVAKQRDATSIIQARAQAAMRLSDLEDEAQRQPWQERAAFFERGANSILTDISKGFVKDSRSRLAEAFQDDWAAMYAPRRAEVKHSAFLGERDQNRATLDQSLDTFAKQAAQARSDVEAEGVRIQAVKQIADMQGGGWITAEEAGEQVRGFARRLDQNRANALIKDDPNAAMLALTDSTKFAGLREEDRLVLQGRAESRLQHEAAMADHAAVVAQRNRKLAGDELAKEGFDLLAKGQMTEEWLTKNRPILDTSDYRMLREGTQRGGGTDSAAALSGIFKKLYIDGEDVGNDVLTAMTTGSLSVESAKSLLDENKSLQGLESPIQQGRKYVAGALKVSEINPDPAAAQRLANAMASFNQQMREDPKQDPMELARSVVKTNAIVSFQDFTLVKPLPKYAVGTRQSLDVKASRVATKKAYLQKHGGDEALLKQDPDYLRELRNLKEWEVEIEKLRAAQDAKAGNK